MGNRAPIAAMLVLCLAGSVRADDRPAPRRTPPSDSLTDRQLAKALMVTGAIIDLSALAFGAYALSLRNEAREGGCRADLTGCPSSALPTAESAYTAANRTTVLFGIGTVVIGVGVYLRLTSAPPRAVSISPAIGPDTAGATLSGSF